MKTRNGWVSNSSSSSFVIIGEYVGIDRIDEDGISFTGDWLSEGRDYFLLTKEIKEFIKKNPEIIEDRDCSLLKVYEEMNEEMGISVASLKNSIQNIPDSATIQTITVDYHSNNTLADFKEHYCRYM